MLNRLFLAKSLFFIFSPLAGAEKNLEPPKSQNLPLALGARSFQSMAHHRSQSLPLVLETRSFQSMAHRRSQSLPLVLETRSFQSMAYRRSQSLPLVLETRSFQSMAHRRSQSLPLVLEARSITKKGLEPPRNQIALSQKLKPYWFDLKFPVQPGWKTGEFSNKSSIKDKPGDKIPLKPINRPNKKAIFIGSKIFTENVLLAEMLALLLEERHGLKVIRKFNMGGTQLVFSALRRGDIDIYPEYTGTGWVMILKKSRSAEPKKTYHAVKKEFLKRFNLIWSLPLGFENTYALAVHKKDPRFKSVNQISQLKGQAPLFRLALSHEFAERKDGFKNFIKKYKLNFLKNNILTMNAGLMFSALDNKKTDIIIADSTDGRIKAFNLKTLKDDKKFFPSYQAAYLTRSEALSQSPEIKQAFQSLEGSISEKEMIRLNSQVDQLKKGVSKTARGFLIKKSLLKGKAQAEGEQSLLAYYMGRKKYLFKILMEHLILVFSSLFFALLFSVPAGLWAARQPSAGKAVFALVNTLQTVPSLALLGLFVPLLGIGFLPAICALFLYSLLPIIRNTFEGLKNVDRHFIEVSSGMGLSQWQILKYVQIPLALPVMLAGVRTSAVTLVGTAALAAFIGAGGLGDPIFRGISILDSRLIFLGAVPACLLAVALDQLLALLESLMISKGLKLEKSLKNLEWR